MTYTLYDKQGRIMETGEAKIACKDFAPFSGNIIPDNIKCAHYNAVSQMNTSLDLMDK